MMRIRFFSTIPVFAFILPVLLSAQMFVTRDVDVRTSDDTAVTGRFSGQTHGFTEWQHGYGSIGDEQAWDVRAGFTMDLVRSHAAGMLRISMNGELLANPYNETRFNPRGAYFEPVLTLDRSIGGLDWQFSVFHRCRHDVDNLDPADPRQGINGMRYKRVIILSGPQLGVGSQPIAVGHGINALISGRVEAYPLRIEERRPDDGLASRWDHAIGATTLALRLSRHFTKTVEPYVRGWETLVLFGQTANASAATELNASQASRSNFNGRLEIGTRFAGMSGNADVFAAFEHTFDDLTPPHGNAGHVLFVGVRLAARGFE